MMFLQTRRIRISYVIALFACLTFAVSSARSAETPPAAPTAPSFDRELLPVLTAKCGRCHGAEVQKGELDLRSAQGVRKGGEGGEIFVPGKPDESRLYEVLHGGEMPPDGENPLTEAEVDLVRRWIEAGAPLPQESGDSRKVVTQQEVLPVLFLRCVPCHGLRKQEGGLDLRTRETLLKGGKSGLAVVAGKPDESLVVQRVRKEEMPPRRQLVAASVKTMEASELQLLEDWIAAGLPESPVGPDVATTEPDRLVTDEDRQFWSFRPPQAVAPPIAAMTPEDRERIRTPIDVFVLAKLRERGLSLSPEADRVTLIRRLSFDLIGLPPTPEEVAAFVDDPRPDAYDALVERLLASPHYGERWARHWLDVAGYADSEGSQNEDRIRPTMWRYRDYVIRAFNADKPYDRFLQEQLAGDELADYEHAPAITEELYDNLVATGFLRTAPDRTFANITNFVPDRLEIIADEIQIFSSSVLGLTFHCARCHSHKFDPLPQRDYYRLAAAFKDALDEHDWIGPEDRRLPYVLPDERQAWLDHKQAVDARIAPLKQQLEQAVDDAAKKPIQEQIDAIEKERRPEPMIRALWARGEPSPTWLLKRGNYLTPGQEVGPGVPSVLTDGRTPFVVERPRPDARTTGRRLALARWVTQPDHPLTSRVIVNRVWKHHFGAGIVTTLGNFGKTGAAPTHPELLDWLAVEFVRGGWSLKQLHRQIVHSAAYRQSSQVTEPLASADPDNRWLSRMPLRRIEAEPLRDSLLSVSGQLDETLYGPPAEADVRGDGLVTAVGGRRSVYALYRRTKMPTILENFDSPQMGPNCIERGESIVAPQALHLLNNAIVKDLAGKLAERALREAGDDRAAQVRWINQLAFAEAPTNSEIAAAVQALEALEQKWRQSLGDGADSEAARRALQNYCHAIVNSAGFVYVD
ncbi:MAG: PSD1 and planctomycete cytochrome C domain-containing protein [Planctomycetaceae bacterium]